VNHLSELASSCDHPTLSLPSSEDYRREPLTPGNVPISPVSLVTFVMVHLFNHGYPSRYKVISYCYFDFSDQ
jgi:hypothetical protein